MALTIGDAPFGGRRSGTFNFDTGVLRAHTLYFEDCGRRIRGEFGGETVVDSVRVKRLHETGLLPVFYFPDDDLRADLLQPSDHSSDCPFKGKARYQSVVVGDRIAQNAVWRYPEPLPGAPSLAGYSALYWQAIDAWFEEDEPIFAHPRDPYHRVDVLRSSRRVRVRLGETVIAKTDRPMLVFETSLPTRYYIPKADVRTSLLETSEKTTECPYKGTTRYWSAAVNDQRWPDVAWEYPRPLAESARLADTLCFLGDDVVIEVDGQLAN